MRVLITGFEPFGSRSLNNSWEIIKSFEDREGIDILLLPVSFSRAHKIAIDKISKGNYGLIIMIGETSSNNDYIRLERLAINLKDSINPDNDGEVANENPLLHNCSNAYFTKFSVKESAKYLKELGYKVKVSNSAGTFVCNSLYYHVLHFLNTNNAPSTALFIHVPATTEILSLENMKNTLEALINKESLR